MRAIPVRLPASRSAVETEAAVNALAARDPARERMPAGPPPDLAPIPESIGTADFGIYLPAGES